MTLTISSLIKAIEESKISIGNNIKEQDFKPSGIVYTTGFSIDADLLLAKLKEMDGEEPQAH